MKALREAYRVDESGCWVATVPMSPAGYGYIFRDGTKKPLHRVAWEELRGPIPDGMELDHLCRNRACCNPDHLEPVSHAENVRRGIAGEVNRERMLARTTCKNGHPWDSENTKQTGRQRKCRTCEREQQRARRARKAVA